MINDSLCKLNISSSDNLSTKLPESTKNIEEQIIHQKVGNYHQYIRKFKSKTKEFSESVPKRELKVWTIEEDQLLKIYYSKYKNNWKKIALMIPNRNASQCCQRFRRKFPIKVRQLWTKKEDEKLLDLYKEYGNDWMEISQHFENKKAKQIRERYINHLSPEINHGAWNEIEDELLIHWYQQLGSKWSEIAKNIKGRSGNMIKNRFYSYHKRVFNVEKDFALKEEFEKINTFLNKSKNLDSKNSIEANENIHD